MAIIKGDPYQKKSRKNAYALDGQKIRPIPREEFSGDVSARAVFIAANAGKLSKGRSVSQRRFGAASGGQQISRPLGGGTYEPNAVPHNPGNLGTT